MIKQIKALKLEGTNKYIVPSSSDIPERLRGVQSFTEIVEYEVDEQNNDITEYLSLQEGIKYLSYLHKVKEFMTICNQPVIDKPSIMPEDRNKLRIALIFEELKEYAEASGLLDYFIILCDNIQDSYFNKQKEKPYIPIKNITEQFDALLDLQYVLSGAVLENGFGDIFDKGFAEVHRSNMSKLVNNQDELLATFEKYKGEDIDVYFGTNTQNPEEDTVFPTPVYRLLDDKVLKSINYSPANLDPIINK